MGKMGLQFFLSCTVLHLALEARLYWLHKMAWQFPLFFLFSGTTSRRRNELVFESVVRLTWKSIWREKRGEESLTNIYISLMLTDLLKFSIAACGSFDILKFSRNYKCLYVFKFGSSTDS